MSNEERRAGGAEPTFTERQKRAIARLECEIGEFDEDDQIAIRALLAWARLALPEPEGEPREQLATLIDQMEEARGNFENDPTWRDACLAMADFLLARGVQVAAGAQ